MLFGANKGKIKQGENFGITFNRDFQATSLFLKNKENQTYDSFIFGNSKSFFFEAESWTKYINGNIFHFNASGESIFGIIKKLEFLDRNNVAIKQALVVLDYSTLTELNDSKGHLLVKHPQISQSNYLSFYIEMFKGFFPKAYFAHLQFYCTAKRQKYMAKYGIRQNTWKLNPQNNQLAYFLFEEQIEKDSKTYYKKHPEFFVERRKQGKETNRIIFEERKIILNKVKSIFDKHGCTYKIIFGPVFNQKKINQKDLNYIAKLFGKAHVFDFTGKNAFNESEIQYYDINHYRPMVSDSILNYIYNL